MTNFAPARILSILTGALALLVAGSASAQTCGDADGSGTVTVTDGVQVLRAAAGLSSSCTTARCDVDGSGGITVTDGVNVLRKVAGLSAPDACPGATGDGVEEAVDAVVPFLAFGFAFASEVNIAGGAARVLPAGNDVDDCPAGGTRTKIFTGAVLRIEFAACGYQGPGLGSFRFDRRILINFVQSQVALSLSVTDVDSGRVVDFDGFFAFTPRGGGGFVANGQDIVMTTPQGDFTLDLNQLTVDGDGRVLSGGGSIADTSDNFALERIDFQVTGPGSGELSATFDDGSTKTYTLNLVTGALVET